jgi:hypothetical protein
MDWLAVGRRPQQASLDRGGDDEPDGDQVVLGDDVLLGRVQVRQRPDELLQQAGQVLRAGAVAEAPAVPDDVAGHEDSRLVRVVLVEGLVDVVARELLIGLELLGEWSLPSPRSLCLISLTMR